MNRVFLSMGTAVSLSGDISDASANEIVQAFAELDERFSLYRETSEASRIARRDLVMTHASPDFRSAYELASSWRSDTEGAFTPHRPDGVIDLNGVVKALAIQRAGDILDAFESRHWCVNAGGDLLTRTRTSGAPPWVAGIVDPADRGRLLTQFRLDEALPALATSGIAERGEHVWRIGAWDADPDPFVQVSVAAVDIMTADVLATAILSGGRPTLALATRKWPVEVIAVSRSGELRATSAFRRVV